MPLGGTSQILWVWGVKASSFPCSSQWWEVTFCSSRECVPCSPVNILLNLSSSKCSLWSLLHGTFSEYSYLQEESLLSEVLLFMKCGPLLNYIALLFFFPKCKSDLLKDNASAMEASTLFLFSWSHIIWTCNQPCARRCLVTDLLKLKYEVIVIHLWAF